MSAVPRGSQVHMEPDFQGRHRGGLNCANHYASEEERSGWQVRVGQHM